MAGIIEFFLQLKNTEIITETNIQQHNDIQFYNNYKTSKYKFIKNVESLMAAIYI